MTTYRQLVYTIFDELKILSDDTVWESEHIVSMLNKYRALLFTQKYKGKKVEIPSAYYQRLNVEFSTKIGTTNIYKSIKRLPNNLDITDLWKYTFISTNGISTQNLNFINPQRFKNVGFNKWIKNELYSTIDLDNHMYINSLGNKYIDTTITDIVVNTIKSIKFGKLYNWYAVTSGNNIAPAGWRVPTYNDLDTLSRIDGDINTIGIKLKSTDTLYWDNNSIANNEYSLSLVGSGSYVGGIFSGLKQVGYYWTNTQTGGVDTASSFGVGIGTYFVNGTISKKNGISIRLIKNNLIDEGDLTDIDGNVYNTVRIGDQIWTKQNLAVIHYSNGNPILSDFNNSEGAVIDYNNNESNSFNTTQVVVSSSKINGSILYDTILDNPTDINSFNNLNILDVLDLEFPCEESLIQPIVDQCLKELGTLNQTISDNSNDASDDAQLQQQKQQK